MSSAVIRMRSKTTISLQNLSQAIIVSPDMKGAELALEQLKEVKSTKVLLLVFEKFYLRTGSMAAVTIQVLDDGQEQSAVIVGTGGGYGVFNVSMGANSNFACKAANALTSLGFEEL